jgi:glutamate synthase domain-containing protein 3
MHGGIIYVRGDVPSYKLGREVKKEDASSKDLNIISYYVKKFSKLFEISYHSIINHKFTKFFAHNKRPYEKLYAH